MTLGKGVIGKKSHIIYTKLCKALGSSREQRTQLPRLSQMRYWFISWNSSVSIIFVPLKANNGFTLDSAQEAYMYMLPGGKTHCSLPKINKAYSNGEKVVQEVTWLLC